LQSRIVGFGFDNHFWYDIHTSYKGGRVTVSGKFAVSRIGVRSQTVIPKAVRDTLSIRPGDQIGFVIANGKVELVKVVPAQDNPFACFEEWDSDADTKGYRSF
jgi:antitoxin PrlF